MASKFYAAGLKQLMDSIITGSNYIDFGVGDSNPSVVVDSNYISHSIGQLDFAYSATSGSAIYTNNNTVYYFDKVPGAGAATSHTGNSNLKWVVIRASSTILFQIKLASSAGLDVAGPSGSTPGNQVKLGAYTTAGSGRGIYIKLSSAVA